MAWVSIDDQFHDHPKAERVGPLGRDLYVAGLEYANRNLTDGFIPKATAGRLVSFYDIPGADITVNPYDIVQLLLDAGMWDLTDGGYQIHDYLEYQPSSDEVARRREQKRERQQRWREKQAAEDAASNKEESTSQDASVDASTDALRDELHDAQTQVPSPKSQEPNSKRPKPGNISARTRGASKPEPHFDAFMAAFYPDKHHTELTKGERGELNSCCKQLRDISADASEIPIRKARYHAKWPDIDCTPSALVNHWNKFDHEMPARASPSRNGERPDPATDWLTWAEEHDESQDISTGNGVVIDATATAKPSRR